MQESFETKEAHYLNQIEGFNVEFNGIYLIDVSAHINECDKYEENDNGNDDDFGNDDDDNGNDDDGDGADQKSCTK